MPPPRRTASIRCLYRLDYLRRLHHRRHSPPPRLMKSYVIIFRQGPLDSSDEVNARRQREIVAWAAKHQGAGHQLEPRALEIDVRRPGINAPDDASAWPIVALVFLEARDIDEAAAIAADHPARNYNVSTEVRPWTARKVPEARLGGSRS